MTLSPLHQARLGYQPRQPSSLKDLAKAHLIPTTEPLGNFVDEDAAEQFFPETYHNQVLELKEGQTRETGPLRVGVVLSGGQAPGGHNVITGLFDALKQLNPDSVLLGFLNGPAGLVDNQTRELTQEIVDQYRNTGGFDMIGSGRTKIETPEQFQQAEQTARALNLDGIVVIGGDDSNTNAGLLAEHFIMAKCPTAVIGVPKTIDGDLKGDLTEISFGFDTATKVYSEFIGNLARDSQSAGKYTFFVKLMGRAASHVALEVALQTHPNLALISEEVSARKWTLKQVTDQIADVICARAEAGKNYGVILIPEGIIEFIPEFEVMIAEINRLLADGVAAEFKPISERLSDPSRKCFAALPELIQEQLLLTRDSHGNVQVSKIESERLLIETVTQELESRTEKGTFNGKFSAQPQFCGYEGRSGFPSNFDCNYCYALGRVASVMVKERATGYMACVRNLTEPAEKWEGAAVPIASMITREERKGKLRPVIQKALVELEAAPFTAFVRERDGWVVEDAYRYPGPIQFAGAPELTDCVTKTLELEANTRMLFPA